MNNMRLEQSDFENSLECGLQHLFFGSFFNSPIDLQKLTTNLVKIFGENLAVFLTKQLLSLL